MAKRHSSRKLRWFPLKMNKSKEIKLLRCSRCKKMLPTSSFWKYAEKTRGYGYLCKDCKKKALIQSGWWKVFEKRRKSNPENAVKIRARAYARSAVKRGLIESTVCLTCGSAKKLELHHYKGYKKENWLLVRSYCPPHHKEQHKLLTPEPKEKHL